MAAAAALHDLREISPQIHAALLLDDAGEPLLASAGGDAQAFARAARELIVAADDIRRGQGHTLVRLHVATRAGRVFAVRSNGGWLVATAEPGANRNLVLHDLETCVSSLERETAHARA